MFVEDLHIIKPSPFGPYTTIQAAIQAALVSNPPSAVMIAPDYAGTDTYTNASGVTILDLRQGSVNTGSQFGSGAAGAVATVAAAGVVVGSSGVVVGSAGVSGSGVTVGGVKSGVVAVAAAAAPITAAAGGTFVTTLNLPGGAGAPFEQVPFTIKASGFVTFPAGTYTATIQPLLYASNAAGFTATAAAAIYSAAATSITFASATLPVTKPFSIEAHLIGDSTSKVVTGWTQGTGYVGGAALNNAILANTIITTPTPAGGWSFTATAAVPVQFQFGIVGGAGLPATSVINLGSFFIEA